MSARDALDHVLAFGAHLRGNGFPVGIDEQRILVDMLLASPPDAPRRIRLGWRAAVCRDARQWQRYDELFDSYWYPGRLRGTLRSTSRPSARRDLLQLVAALQAGDDRGGQPEASDAPTSAGDAPPAERPGGASATEALAPRPLAGWSGQEEADFEALARRLCRRLRRQLLRRFHPALQGSSLDIRATLRASLATGGLPLAPVWQRRARRPRPPLVLVT